MIDFDVQKCTRRCAKTDRELQAGEVMYSVLIAEDANVVRKDFCEQAWEGPPDDAIAHWKSVTPEPNTKKTNWAPNDVMLDFFVQLENQPGKEDIRYILTLLMIRRRIVKLENTQTDEAGNEIMVVFCSRNDTEYMVPAIVPTRQRAGEIQDELAHLLDTDAA